MQAVSGRHCVQQQHRIHSVGGSRRAVTYSLPRSSHNKNFNINTNQVSWLRCRRAANVFVLAQGGEKQQDSNSGSSLLSGTPGSSLLGGAPRSGSSLLGGTPSTGNGNVTGSGEKPVQRQGVSGSSLLGGAPPPSLSKGSTTTSTSSAIGNIDDLELSSGLGVDYSKLRDLLKEGKWREAEDETRAKLIEAAGPAAQKRNWVYWSEVKTIPVADMLTLDALWSVASKGRFGYKVQRQMWIQNRRQWNRFFRAIDWVTGENDVYRKWPTEFKYDISAPKGHLPLTNALRGTRLFEAIMEHEAFTAPKKQ